MPNTRVVTHQYTDGTTIDIGEACSCAPPDYSERGASYSGVSYGLHDGACDLCASDGAEPPTEMATLIAARLARPIPALSRSPIGMTSSGRARHLMMEPSVAGTGSIYVDRGARQLLYRDSLAAHELAAAGVVGGGLWAEWSPLADDLSGDWLIGDGTTGGEPVADGRLYPRREVVEYIRRVLRACLDRAAYPHARRAAVVELIAILDAIEAR